MPKKTFVLILFVLLSPVISAQFINDFNGSLETQATYYTDDDKVANPGDTDFRSNNYLRFNYFKNKFKASIQFESYIEEALLGYAPDLNQKFGLSMASFSYSTKDLKIAAGFKDCSRLCI